jgi:hypothetical protein
MPQWNALTRAWQAKQRRPIRALSVAVDGRALMEADAEDGGSLDAAPDNGQTAMAAAFAGLAAANPGGGGI